MFAPSAVLEWARNYLAYVFERKHDFPPYTMSPRNAIYDLLDENGTENVRVSVAGDWGTGTDEAWAVADQMMRFTPHFTIHIGDVYYVGDAQEVNENCLGVKNPNNNYDPLTWPIGSLGSFALNGNHEMYANGTGYFDLFLPKLGLCTPARKMLGQQTSFFCLQNRHWRVIAIDTGYNSTGLPILSHLPVVNLIPGVGPSCKLPDAHIEWLKQRIVSEGGQRGTVIMSHHQYYSGFEERYRKPAQQLWDAGVRQPVLWFWGHEHRLAGYDLFGSDHLKAFGRCVGHGGMPVSRGGPTRSPSPIFYDDRLAPNGFGVNGFVNLGFDNSNLHVSYIDLHGNLLVEEDWSAPGDGTVQLRSIRGRIKDKDFHGPPEIAIM
jgi:hypothetical protein